MQQGEELDLFLHQVSQRWENTAKNLRKLHEDLNELIEKWHLFNNLYAEIEREFTSALDEIGSWIFTEKMEKGDFVSNEKRKPQKPQKLADRMNFHTITYCRPRPS